MSGGIRAQADFNEGEWINVCRNFSVEPNAGSGLLVMGGDFYKPYGKTDAQIAQFVTRPDLINVLGVADKPEIVVHYKVLRIGDTLDLDSLIPQQVFCFGDSIDPLQATTSGYPEDAALQIALQRGESLIHFHNRCLVSSAQITRDLLKKHPLPVPISVVNDAGESFMLEKDAFKEQQRTCRPH